MYRKLVSQLTLLFFQGAEKTEIRSKYEEDVYINNHTSVWGSFWANGSWGYKCCHSFVKVSNHLSLLRYA